VEGLLEEGGVKLAAVVSDVFGASGWAMLEQRLRPVIPQALLQDIDFRGCVRHNQDMVSDSTSGLSQPNRYHNGTHIRRRGEACLARPVVTISLRKATSVPVTLPPQTLSLAPAPR
jgi:hypothetical protein